MTDLRRHVPPLTLVVGRRGTRCAAPHRRRHAGLRRRVGLHRAHRAALAAGPDRRRGDRRDAQPGLRADAGASRRPAAASCSSSAATPCSSSSAGEGHPEQACDAAVEMRAALRAGRRRAHVGRAASRCRCRWACTPGDVAALPRRLAHPRAAGARARRDPRPPGREGGRAPARSSSARRPRPGCRAGPTRPREDGAAAAAPPARRARHPGGPHPCRPTVDATACATLFPIALGEYLAPGPPDPEHRVATIAFVRFSGTDAILAQQGPQALGRALHELVTHGRGGAGGRGRHAAGHRPRHRRRQVLPRRRACRAPARTTRAGCCAPCGGSPMPACPCRCSSG